MPDLRILRVEVDISVERSPAGCTILIGGPDLSPSRIGPFPIPELNAAEWAAIADGLGFPIVAAELRASEVASCAR